jgi:hypothetical protein
LRVWPVDDLRRLALRTAVIKNEAAAMAAAEAGYESAVYWMSQQPDMISALDDAQASGSLEYDGSDCDYSVKMASFLGASPVYAVRSVGHSGRFERTVEVHIVQAIGGWSMGMCRFWSSDRMRSAGFFPSSTFMVSILFSFSGSS